MMITWQDDRLNSSSSPLSIPSLKGLWFPDIVHVSEKHVSPIKINKTEVKIVMDIITEEKCLNYSFYIPSYITVCPLTITNQNQKIFWSQNSSEWQILSWTQSVSLFSDSNENLSLKIYNQRIYILLILLSVYSLLYMIDIITFRNMKSNIMQLLPLLLKLIFPVIFKIFIDVDMSFNIITLFFGWNVIIALIPTFYLGLVLKRDKVKIGMYASAKDEDGRRKWKQTQKTFLILYISSMFLSLIGLISMFYSAVKENVLDLIRKTI